MITLKLAMRESRSRPLRAILTLLSVIIGVAAMVSVNLASKSTSQAFNAVYESVAGRAALEVRAVVGTTFPEKLAKDLAEIPGVKTAAPRIQRTTKLIFNERPFVLMALGIDRDLDQDVQNYKLQSGDWYNDINTVVLSEAFAGDAGIKPGDRIGLMTHSGLARAKVSGLYTTDVSSAGGQAPMLLMSLKLAQKWQRSVRRLDAIQIVLDDDSRTEEVQKAVKALLPETATVKPPAGRSSMAAETSLSTEQGLLMARALSMLVAVFIIAITFLISVTQRRRQFGIMRAIGATKLQIAKTIYAQALLLGAVGTLLGCLAGVGAAYLLAQAMGDLYETTLPAPRLTLEPFLWALGFGMGVSLLGAALPAWKASKLSPLEAMRDVLPAEIEGASRGAVFAGIAVTAFAGAVLAASITGRIEMRHAVWSAMLLLVGMVMLLPVALRPLAAGVARLVPRGMRVEARLASRHLLTHRLRTTLTVGGVFVAVTAGIALANSVMDNVNNVKQWYRNAIVADFIVRATSPDTSTGLSVDIPDDVEAEIAKVPGIDDYDTVRGVLGDWGEQQILIVASGFDNPRLAAFDLPKENDAEVRRLLDEGQVVVGSVLGQRAGVKRGDKLTVKLGERSRDFTVAAVANDYQAGGMTVYMDTAVAKKVMGISGVSAFTVQVKPGQLEAVRTSLRDLARENGLLLQASSDIQNKIDGMMAGVIAGFWSMVVLTVLVAVFGVTNTLTMSVIEQTFELGLLRIIATTRNQVRKMIFAQALVIGLLAVTPAVAAGVTVAYLINLSTQAVIGHPVAFGFYPMLLLGGLAGSLALVLAAAYLPAERAARLELPTAIRMR